MTPEEQSTLKRGDTVYGVGGQWGMRPDEIIVYRITQFGPQQVRVAEIKESGELSYNTQLSHNQFASRYYLTAADAWEAHLAGLKEKLAKDKRAIVALEERLEALERLGGP